MRRLSKAVPVVLSLGLLCLLGVFAASCGSSGNAHVRIVDAISDSPALDINVNTTKTFTNLTFASPQPTPPAYSSVPGGTVTLQAVLTNTTTPFINSVNTTLSGSGHYTLLMTGFTNGTSGSAPTFWTISDNNTAPTAGNVEFRIINASANSISLTGGLNIYIVLPGQGLGTPAVSGLTLGQGSAYVPESFSATGYTIYVTDQFGNQKFNNTYQTPTGSIRTLVILDSGNQISSFLELNDLG